MNIITVTPNPALDVHLKCEDFVGGGYNKARSISRDSGGKGINVSRALAANSIESECFMILGKDGSDEFILPLYNIGMRPECVFVPGRVRENINVHHGDTETVIATSGPAVGREAIAELEGMILERATKDSFVCFSGSISDGSDRDAFISMLCKLKERGSRLVIDSRSVSTEELLFLKPYLIKPNEEEAEMLTGMRPRTLEDAAKIASAVKGYGCENVMLTMGGVGAVLASPSGVYAVHSPKVIVRSTVGAGDSSVAGFLAARLSGLDDGDSLQLAMAYGSAACMSEGSAPPLADNIAYLREKISVYRLSAEM